MATSGLASTALTTCFILSQREAACRRLLDSGNAALCTSLAVARGRSRFATVGLSCADHIAQPEAHVHGTNGA